MANNFPYVIMLSAAFDILSQLEDSGGGGGGEDNVTNSSSACALVYNSTTNASSYPDRECNKISTSVCFSSDNS